jgi:hypothetical protein
LLEISLESSHYLTESNDEQRVVPGKAVHQLEDVTSGTVREY